MPEGRAGATQALDVFGFVVWGASLPAAKDDAQPFESEFTQHAVSGFVRIGILRHVQIEKGASPTGEAQRRERILHQALTLEGRTSPTHGDEFLFSALVRDRRSAGKHLEFGRAGKAAAVLAEEHGQSWTQAGAGAREAGKNAICIENFDQLLDALLIGADDARESSDVLQQALYPQALRLDHARIAGQRARGRNEIEALLDQLLAARTVTVKEGVQSGGPDTLKFFQSRPTSDKGMGQRRRQIGEEFERQREVEFQRGLQTLQGLSPLIDEATSILAVLGALTHRRTLGTVAAQARVMFEEELSQERGVDRIALCAGGIKRLAVALQTEWLDWIKVDKVKGAQEMDECAFALFDGNGNAAAGKTLLHRADPFHQRIGFVFQGGELGLGLVLDRKLQGRQSVFLIGLVDANNGSVAVQIKRTLFCSGIVRIHRLGFELSCVCGGNPSTVKYLQRDLTDPVAKGSFGSE